MPEHSPEENQNEAPGTPPSGKTFSEDYVSSLRNESAGYRNAAKTYETALRKVPLPTASPKTFFSSPKHSLLCF